MGNEYELEGFLPGRRCLLLKLFEGCQSSLDFSPSSSCASFKRSEIQKKTDRLWPGTRFPIAVLKNCVGFAHASCQYIAEPNLSLRGVERRSNLSFDQLEIASGSRPRNDNLPTPSPIQTGTNFENPYKYGDIFRDEYSAGGEAQIAPTALVGRASCPSFIDRRDACPTKTPGRTPSPEDQCT
jgi:hypothetical protein